VDDWLGLRDRTVLIAGAGGLGGASALALAGLGARVLAVDVDQARLAELGQRISEHGGHLEAVAADLTDPEACRRVVRVAWATSMLQDVQARRPTEIGALNGGIVARGREAGIPVPLNQAVTALINGLKCSWA
jgi:ketopantoate reductase